MYPPRSRTPPPKQSNLGTTPPRTYTHKKPAEPHKRNKNSYNEPAMDRIVRVETNRLTSTGSPPLPAHSPAPPSQTPISTILSSLHHSLTHCPQDLPTLHHYIKSSYSLHRSMGLKYDYSNEENVKILQYMCALLFSLIVDSGAVLDRELEDKLHRRDRLVLMMVEERKETAVVIGRLLQSVVVSRATLHGLLKRDIRLDDRDKEEQAQAQDQKEQIETFIKQVMKQLDYAEELLKVYRGLLTETDISALKKGVVNKDQKSFEQCMKMLGQAHSGVEKSELLNSLMKDYENIISKALNVEKTYKQLLVKHEALTKDFENLLTHTTKFKPESSQHSIIDPSQLKPDPEKSIIGESSKLGEIILTAQPNPSQPTPLDIKLLPSAILLGSAPHHKEFINTSARFELVNLPQLVVNRKVERRQSRKSLPRLHVREFGASEVGTQTESLLLKFCPLQSLVVLSKQKKALIDRGSQTLNVSSFAKATQTSSSPTFELFAPPTASTNPFDSRPPPTLDHVKLSGLLNYFPIKPNTILAKDHNLIQAKPTNQFVIHPQKLSSDQLQAQFSPDSARRGSNVSSPQIHAPPQTPLGSNLSPQKDHKILAASRADSQVLERTLPADNLTPKVTKTPPNGLPIAGLDLSDIVQQDPGKSTPLNGNISPVEKKPWPSNREEDESFAMNVKMILNPSQTLEPELPSRVLPDDLLQESRHILKPVLPFDEPNFQPTHFVFGEGESPTTPFDSDRKVPSRRFRLGEESDDQQVHEQRPPEIQNTDDNVARRRPSEQAGPSSPNFGPMRESKQAVLLDPEEIAFARDLALQPQQAHDSSEAVSNKEVSAFLDNLYKKAQPPSQSSHSPNPDHMRRQSNIPATAPKPASVYSRSNIQNVSVVPLNIEPEELIAHHDFANLGRKPLSTNPFDPVNEFAELPKLKPKQRSSQLEHQINSSFQVKNIQNQEINNAMSEGRVASQHSSNFASGGDPSEFFNRFHQVDQNTSFENTSRGGSNVPIVPSRFLNTNHRHSMNVPHPNEPPSGSPVSPGTRPANLDRSKATN